MKIEMGKEYKTRDGRQARVLCVDRPHDEWPVVALIDGEVETFGADGAYFRNGDPSRHDLMPVEAPVALIAAERERIAVWLELKADGPNRNLIRTKGNIFRAVAKAIRNGDYLSEGVQP